MRLATSLLCLACTVSCQFAYGLVPGVVADRATVESILGASARTEDFESIALPPSGLLQLGTVLNSETVHLGNGPGLVIPGVSFIRSPDTQIYSPAFTGGDSQRLGFSSGSPFVFRFSPPVRAVAIDLFIGSGIGGNPFVVVRNASGVQLAGFSLGTVNSKTVPTFLGYESEDGISEISVATFIGGPIFDNVTFGPLVPEPASELLAILAMTGVLILRRIGNRALHPNYCYG
jgi:hypothetical protein